MSRRVERVNSVIRAEISDLIQKELKDPRLSGLITVTRVSTSPDLHYAKVYVSVLGAEKDQKAVLVALASASGFLRKEISRRLRLRITPEFSFHYDDTIDQASHVIQLINEVVGETGDKKAGED